MQVTIRGKEKEIYVQTITLQPEISKNLYGFHCLGCGNFHQKIGGKVSKIYPIYEPNEQMVVVSRCRNCGAEYNFQTYDGYSSEKIKVILHPLEGGQTTHFYCYSGKDLLLDYTLQEIYSWEDNKNKKTPFVAHCQNTNCNLEYFFSDIF